MATTVENDLDSLYLTRILSALSCIVTSADFAHYVSKNLCNKTLIIFKFILLYFLVCHYSKWWKWHFYIHVNMPMLSFGHVIFFLKKNVVYYVFFLKNVVYYVFFCNVTLLFIFINFRQLFSKPLCVTLIVWVEHFFLAPFTLVDFSGAGEREK